jgi:hypothetical protein
MPYNGDADIKYMQPKLLARELMKLPPNVIVACNQVGNLSIFRADDLKFVGYIDFLGGSFQTRDDRGVPA